jgi:hypothetical protein
MTPELIATLCDHVQGNLRALMNMAGELLALAAQQATFVLAIRGLKCVRMCAAIWS